MASNTSLDSYKVANELSSLVNNPSPDDDKRKKYSLQAHHSPTGSHASLRSYHDEIGIHILEDDLQSETSFERFWHQRQQRRIWTAVIVIAAIALIIISAVLFGGSLFYYGNNKDSYAISFLKDPVQTMISHRSPTLFHHLLRTDKRRKLQEIHTKTNIDDFASTGPFLT